MMEHGHPVVLEPVSIRKRYIPQPYFANDFITNNIRWFHALADRNLVKNETELPFIDILESLQLFLLVLLGISSMIKC